VPTFAPKKGERYAVRRPFKAIVMTHWFAPFTGGDERDLPEGLEFVIDNDPVPGATGVGAMPDPKAFWEEKLVAQEDRTAEKYGGFSLSLSFDQIERNCERV
jgi:hypothetical protein